MKKKLLLGLFIAPLLFFAQINVAFAHTIGQPPFFKVNGKYSPLYKVPTTSLTDFELPQDAGPESYLVNEPIQFEIDHTQLQVPLVIFQKTTFDWDMGDGTNETGSKVTYTYSKPGSYIIKITADYEGASGAQLFQSILVNILPDKSYILPVAIFSINSKTPSDPLTDIINLKFGQELLFDASKSTGIISEYFWDFGDAKSTNEKEVKHTYSIDLPQQQVFPVLRVKDNMGFIADTFAEVDNKGGSTASTVPSITAKARPDIKVLIGGVILIIIVVGGLFLGVRYGKK